MALKRDAKFEEKLTCDLENDMKSLAKFHQTTVKNLKIGILLGSFIQSRKYVSLKLTVELMCRDN